MWFGQRRSIPFSAFCDIWVAFTCSTKQAAPLISKHFYALSSTLSFMWFWLPKLSQLIHSQTLQWDTYWFRFIAVFNLQLEMIYSEGCPVSPFRNLSAKFLYTVLKCYSQSDIIPHLFCPHESELSPSVEALSWSRSSFLDSELWKLKDRPMPQW